MDYQLSLFEDLIEMPIMELVRIRNMRVADEFDANGDPMNFMFELVVNNKNLMHVSAEIVAYSVFSKFIYGATIDLLTKKPYVEILDTNLTNDNFTIEILITASGENRDVMLDKILATLNK